MTSDSVQLVAANPLERGSLVVSWACRLIVAGILLQTLWFKFTWAPETRVIFANLGGRPAATAAGVMELIAALLILAPPTVAIGAALALGIIGGALATHLFVIGIQVVDPATGNGDGGLLFGLALAVALLSAVALALHRAELFTLLARLRGR